MPEPISEKSIFLYAAGLDSPSARAAYLDEVCGSDPAVRARVEGLLAAHDRLGADSPPTTGMESTASAPAPEGGSVLGGRFKLLEVIGEGGMGTVWLAEQQAPVRRLVALKVIKAGMDSKGVLARFEAERQALALMDHPNIARVLDAGATPDGRPYIVMELVKGTPITKYCDDHHLTPRQRLELFIPVCQAVQHAHQKGIIHRDLKPRNVLVAPYDGRPVPKVIDFGVAKAAGAPLTDKTLFTGLGAVVGTPEYMSPEQAELNNRDIDTRSDLYSLGVLLYELLTGSTPLTKRRVKAATLFEVLRVIREEEPPRPSTRLNESKDSLPSISAQRHTEPAKLTRLVRGELDWIVMKALEKDRNRRYESANGFAMDVQRYLADEPVNAGPPSAGYRFRKFARRNRVALGAAALIVVALVLGTVGTAWQAVRATDAEEQTRQHLADEQHARQGAMTAEREAKRQLFGAYTAQAKATRLGGRPGQRLDALDSIARAAALLDPLGLGEDAREVLRDEALGSLELVDLRPVRSWKAIQNLAQVIPTVSHDFDLFAFSQGKSIYIRRPEDPTADVARLPTIDGRHEQFLLFDRQKKYLLRHRPGEFTTHVTEVATGRDVLRAPEVLQHAASDFHPVLPVVAVGDRFGTVRSIDFVTGRETKRMTTDGPVRAVKFDPSGGRLAVCADRVEVHDVDSGTVVWKGPALVNSFVLAWRPDGKWLAVGTTPDIHLFDLENTAVERVICRGHVSSVINLQFHSRGQLLASGSWDGTTRMWDAATGLQVLQVSGQLIGFSDDGRQVACLQGLNVAVFQFVLPHVRTWLSRGKSAGVAVAADGRIAAASFEDGVRLLDLDRQEVLAHLPIGATDDVAFRAASGHLLTCGTGGYYDWPIRTENRDGQYLLTVGSPEAVDPSRRHMRSFHESRDGRTTLVEAHFREEAFVYRAGREPVRLTRPGLYITALSPDGKWAVASSNSTIGVRVWDAQTGVHVRDLPNLGNMRLCFSPDGRTFVANGGADKVIWDVATWTPRFEVSSADGGPAATAFTPDGRIAAIGIWGKGVILMDVWTGRRLGRLDIPNQPILLVDLCFTPDGSRLVAAADYAGVFVWDVRAFREQLATLDLDWDQSNLPAARPTDVPPVRIEIASAPARWWHDLGVAQLRARDYKAAILSLQKTIDLEPRGDPSLFLYRAMARWHGGQKAEAHKDYGRAVEWWEKNSTTDTELQRLRDEVEELLEIRPSK